MPNTGQPIPPPGTQLSFTVTATSTTDPSITQTQTVTFTVPEIDAVSLTSSPTSLSSSPGVAATTTLTLQNDGNVSETVTLSATTPTGLTASEPDADHARRWRDPDRDTDAHARDASTAAQRDARHHDHGQLWADFGSPITTTDEIDLLVQSAQAAAVSTASIAAGAANNSQLASVLSDFSTTLASLQSATSPALFAEAQNDLGNLSKLLSADPALAAFLTQLQPITTAANADNLAGMLSGSTSLFDSITGVLNVEATQQFTVAVTPIEADLDLGQGETFSVQLTDTGNDPVTLNLSARAHAQRRVGRVRVELRFALAESVDLGPRRLSARHCNRRLTSSST